MQKLSLENYFAVWVFYFASLNLLLSLTTEIRIYRLKKVESCGDKFCGDNNERIFDKIFQNFIVTL